jgi:endonuclease-3 related protein
MDQSSAAGMTRRLWNMYQIMNRHFGDLRWWPGETTFEIAVGAILTQNTNWKNVEIAIGQIKKNGLMTAAKLFETNHDVLAELIRSSGYYNVKAKRLKAFVAFLMQDYGGNMTTMFAEDLWELRKKLLSVHGIGEETADSILLYAGNQPVFVIDAYTRRILQRHGIIDDDWHYRDVQQLFMTHLPCNTKDYNQHHALFVNTGKRFCRRKPLCGECPLGEMMVKYGV